MFSLKKQRHEPSLSAQPTPSAPRTKILIVAHNHPGFFPGGGEVLAYRMFEELRESAHYAPVFLGATSRVSREAHPGTAFLSYDGRADEYLFYGDHFDYFLQSQKQSEFLYRDFANFLRDIAPDVVHFHHTLRLGMEALRVTRNVLPHARIVYTLHDYIPLCHRDGQMLRRTDDSLCDSATPARCHQCFPDIATAKFMLREQFVKSHLNVVDAFVSPSRLLADRFAAWGLPPEKIHHIPNGTPDTPPAPPRPIPREGTRNRFGYFGQISHYKGTLLLMEAARILAQRGIEDFSVDVYGNPYLQPESWRERFFAELKACGPHVTFHGLYRPEELPGLMAGVDWVVVPSIWWENAPLVIGEALHHRRPVICSDIGGMAEHVTPGRDGLHFRVGDAHHLAEIMAEALASPQLWENVRQRILPPPSMASCVKNYTAVFQSPNLLLLEQKA